LRLAEHRGLGLDAAHAPAQHGQAIDHRGMAIGADQRVGIGDRLLAFLPGPHDLGQVLEIDLVADAGAGRNDAEIVEGLGAPAQETVALDVALIFELHIGAEGRIVAEIVDDHRMVDHQIDGNQRIDLRGVAAQFLHGVAHGGQIDHGGHAGEILHQHAGRAEIDLVGRFALVLQPRGEGGDIFFFHRFAVFVAHQVLEQHTQCKRQAREVTDFLLDGRQAEIDVVLAADLQSLASLETIWMRGHRQKLPGFPKFGEFGRKIGS